MKKSREKDHSAFADILHTIFFWLSMFIITPLFGTPGTLFGAVDFSGDLSLLCGRYWSRAVCFFNRVKVEARGLENVLHDRPQIFVSNHQGYFDIFALMGYLPVQVRWFSKRVLFWIPFMGWTMSAARFISIDRSDKKAAFKALMEAVQVVKKGRSVIIFPEGTRTPDGEIREFKKGSLILAQRSSAPIVPVSISGSFDVIKKNSFVFRPGKIVVTIGKPIETTNLDKKEKEHLMEKVREEIVRNFERYLE
jgi:1-acyl-sn-glycerol-3-phosphate acyltransferase